MHVGGTLRVGLVIRPVGAGAVAARFFVVDMPAGRPFFTPAILAD